MSEIRKPCFTFLLKNQGKKTKKVELFDAKLWAGHKTTLKCIE